MEPLPNSLLPLHLLLYCYAQHDALVPGSKEPYAPLEGLDIEVTEECDGCGKCVKTCFTGAIVLEDKMARITDACKGCGMCAASCHRVAIKISVSDGNRMLEEAFRRIENCADIT